MNPFQMGLCSEAGKLQAGICIQLPFRLQLGNKAAEAMILECVFSLNRDAEAEDLLEREEQPCSLLS
jgi:hypothetical protein